MNGNKKQFLEIDALFKKWNTIDSPGCSLGVIRNGEFLYESNYGIRNLESKKPITSETLFDIASVSKQFTAACIALLILKDKLSLNCFLNDILSEVKLEHKITIGQLIYQESGIKDFQYSLFMLNNIWEDIESLLAKQLLSFINKLPQLDFTPGNQHHYSNTNYFLLGLIVKQITGKSLADFAEQEIFSKLGMKNTFFYENFSEIKSRNVAIGYSLRDNSYKVNIPNAWVVGPRGVFTTIDDLLLWDQNFYTLKVGGKEFIELLEKPSQEKISGLSTNRWNNPLFHQGYAFGLLTDYYRGEKIIRHGGGHGGYTAEILRFPKKQLTINILTNNGSINPTTLAFKIADILLDNEFQDKSPYTWSSFKHISEEEVNACLGVYYEARFNEYYSISRENGKLILENDWMKSELKAITSDTLIAINNSGLFLVRPKENKIIIENEFYSAEISKCEPIVLEKNQIIEYTGNYLNEQFNHKIQITAEKDKLKFNLKVGVQILKSISKDTFRNDFLQLEFHRKNKAISFVKVNSAGSKGITYNKVI